MRNVLGTETASISYFSIFGEKELLTLKKRLRGMGNAESLGRPCPRRFCPGKMMTILYGTPSPHLSQEAESFISHNWNPNAAPLEKGRTTICFLPFWLKSDILPDKAGRLPLKKCV